MPHLKSCIQTWAPFFKKDASCLKKVQRLVTSTVEGLRGKTYGEMLHTPHSFPLGKRNFRGVDILEEFKILKFLTGTKADYFLRTTDQGIRRNNSY